MKIRIQDLEFRKLEFELQFQPGEIDFGSEVRQVGLLRTEGRAELIREHHGGHASIDDIRLVGKLDGRIEVSCARCLEPVEIPISRSFDLLYRPLESEKGSDEVAINEAETEIGYYSGEGMESGRFAARADSAGGADQDPLPLRLQGPVLRAAG